MNYQIGKINKKVNDTLNLNYKDDVPIFIGKDNISHMKGRHPKDYKKYGDQLKDIIANPTYLARNRKKKSIEFIKEYVSDNEFVLVVVRVSGNDINFVRTMYVMANEKVENYFKYGYFCKF